MGFEPMTPVSRGNRLAGGRTRPLCDPSNGSVGLISAMQYSIERTVVSSKQRVPRIVCDSVTCYHYQDKVAKYTIDIQIKRGLGFTRTRAWLKKIFTSTLSLEDAAEGAEVACVIADDATVHKLNKTYRGIDRTTDVLSFAFADRPENGSVDFPSLPGAGVNLGEIIISYHQASLQAAENGNSIDEELVLLIVHGTLHLLGYDHESGADARKMRSRERSISNHIRKSPVGVVRGRLPG
jgi:probable rRNA maturation factor